MKVLYHGSQNELVEPCFGKGEEHHDFGKGFYLTDSPDLAKEWSVYHPYDVAYLQEIAETQGTLFERLQDTKPTADGLDFIRSYMKSETRAFIDRGDVYLATLGANRLLAYYQEVEKQPLKDGEPLRGFMPNWIGQFYANYQWQTGIDSRDLVDQIPPDWLVAAYPGLHDLDMKFAVKKVNTEVES